MSIEHTDGARRSVSRREFLRLAGVGGGAALLAACGAAPSAPSAGTTAQPGAATTPPAVVETTTTAPLAATAAPAPVAEQTTATVAAATGMAPAAETPTFAVGAQAGDVVGSGATRITWFNSYSTASTKQVIPLVLQAFVKENPDIAVERVGPEANANLQEALLARVAAGNPPDTSTIYSTPAELAAQGSLMAIDEFMATAKLATKDAFFAAPLKSCQWQGKTYGLPSSAGAGAIFLNVAKFKEKGISTKRADFPKTWDEVKALSKEFTVKKGDKIEQAGLVPWTGLDWLTAAWSGLNGGTIFDPTAAKYTLDTDNNVEWLTYWVGWLDDLYGGSLEKFNTSGKWGDTYPGNAFQAGQQAMALGGSWETTDSDIPFEWEVVKLPVGPRGKKSVTGFWPNWWVIPTGSKRPQEAFLFIEYWATKGWEIWYRVITDTPAWKAFPPDILTSKMVSKIGLEKAKDVHQFFATYLEDAIEMWNSPIETFATDTIKSTIDEVLNKKKKPKQALADAQAICQAKLNEALKK